MNRLSLSTGAGTLSAAALVLAFVIHPSAAETFTQGDSTTSVEQYGGRYPSQSDVTRFEDGQRIITHDGNNTDMTIQREGHGNLPPPEAEREFGVDEDRFDGPGFDDRNLEQRFSGPNRFDSNGTPGSKPEPSPMQNRFRQHMMERMGWY